ncbi:replication initiator protein A [Peptoniphilus equinus]|uniref:Replication initiator protein A n=1 Tax=Peptoniphilus equinus TaxID=3016343 RepID=A0ABY7QRB2_9FIRM|nr:replication initiator protein A [Peptoniphilus equinus]WBW49327.1 replication initiator protein A [Peptoniphilus equinus]
MNKTANFYTMYNEVDYIRNTFYKFPKWLDYLNLAPTAKLTYMYILDRYEISIRNRWVDDNGNIYCYFNRDSLASKMQVSAKTITNNLKILEKENLLLSVQQGQGKPNRIYILLPSDDYLLTLLENYQDQVVEDDLDNYVDDDLLKGPQTVENTKKGKNYTSRKVNISPLEGKNLPPINNNINKTEVINNHSFFPNDSESKNEGMNDEESKFNNQLKKIKNLINYDDLVTIYPPDVVGEYFSIIVDTLTSANCTIKIKGQEKNIEVVKSQFWKLNSARVEEAMKRIKDNPQRVYDTTAYIRSVLYDVTLSTTNKYDQEVNYDFRRTEPGQFNRKRK